MGLAPPMCRWGCIAAVLLAVAAAPAEAATYSWTNTVSPSDWSLPANWSGGTSVPTSSDTAYIVNGGTASISSAGATCFYLSLGGTQGTGTVQMTGGSLAGNGGGEYVGDYGGTGTFNQSGGTNSAGSLLLEESGATYRLSGSGVLSGTGESVGHDGNALFQQTGGQNISTVVTIGSGGRYQMSGGTLQLNGGLQNLGVLDFSNSASVVNLSANNILDFSSGTIVNAGSMSFNVGSNSLVLVPSGVNLASVFGSYSNAGMTHVPGTTLVVPAGQGFGGSGTISDPVNCQGTITGAPNSGINLKNGLVLSGNGSVAVGSTGWIDVNDSVSGMGGGTLSGGAVRDQLFRDGSVHTIRRSKHDLRNHAGG